jgi:cell division protein FtsL
MTSWFAEAAVAEPSGPARRREKSQPKPKSRPKPQSKPQPQAQRRPKQRTRTRARSGIAWIVVTGVLLAGVVFVNVAVLRLNLELDKAGRQRTKLHADNAALQSQLSSRLASPRIQAIARQKNGLVDADPATIGYVDVGR